VTFFTAEYGISTFASIGLWVKTRPTDGEPASIASGKIRRSAQPRQSDDDIRPLSLLETAYVAFKRLR